MTVFEELHRVIEEGSRAVVLTVVAGPGAGAKLLVHEDGTTVGDGPAELAGLARRRLCAAAGVTSSSTVRRRCSRTSSDRPRGCS